MRNMASLNHGVGHTGSGSLTHCSSRRTEGNRGNLHGFQTIVDWSAYQPLKQGDWERFIFWYLPGLSFLQVGGAFVEGTSSAASATVLRLLLHCYWVHRIERRKPQPIPE